MRNNHIISKLFREFSNHKTELFVVIISIIAVSSSMLAFGHIMRIFIDHGIRNNDIHSLNLTMTYLIATITVLAVGSFFRSYYINSISEEIINSIRLRIYNKLLSRNIGYFDELKITDIASRLSHDLILIKDIITNTLSFTIRNVFLGIGGIIMMCIQNIKLSLVVIIAIPISLILIKGVGNKVRALARDLHAHKAKLEEVIGETLSNIRIVRAFHASKYRIDAMLRLNIEYTKKMQKYLKLRSMFFALSITVITSLLLLVLWIGGLDVINGTISSGNMVSFIFYATASAFSLGGIAEVFTELQKSFAGAERVFELENSNDSDKKDLHINKEKVNRISFKIEDFSYPTRPDIQIIKSITLDAKTGDFIGIVGPSGSGKSTILQLLIGLYNTQHRSLKINGKIENSDLAYNIAYVPQEPFLFSCSIKENITLGNDSGNIDEAIKIAGLEDLISSLPHGINTYVGEKGMQLSGGQKQRISLARSIYTNPDVLLLDEATSAIDLESENIIIKAIKKFMKDKIIISVAHRLSAIKDSSNIMLILNGQILDQGSHEKLLKNSDLYKHLATFQKL